MWSFPLLYGTFYRGSLPRRLSTDGTSHVCLFPRRRSPSHFGRYLLPALLGTGGCVGQALAGRLHDEAVCPTNDVVDPSQ